MDDKDKNNNELIEIPANAIIIRQSSWAWIWSAVPWGIFLSLSFFIDLITFSILPLVLAAVFFVPRYMSWRKTAYILTNEYIVIIQGAFGRGRRLDIPISQISGIQVQPGFFGTSLGYVSVLLTIKDQGVANLQYTPARSVLVEHIQARIDTSSQPESESEG